MTNFTHRIDLGNVPLIPSRLKAGTDAFLDAAALYVKGDASKYPPVRRKKVAQFWTKKQRGYFFYALKKGLIDVPYTRGSSRRSERLMQRWGIRKQGNTRVIGNNASYSLLMYGRGKAQSLYHKGNWRDIGQIGKDVTLTVRRLVRVHVMGKL